VKDLESVLKVVGEGLRTLAKGINAIAEKLDDFVETPEKPQPKQKPQRKSSKRSREAAKPKKAPPNKGAKPVTATEKVLRAIKASKKGIDTTALMQKTGFDRKKVQNIIFKLKKQGKIKNVAKGVYIRGDRL
jgi:hypothetical protein